MTINQLINLIYINWVRLKDKVEFYQPTFNPKGFPIIKANQFRRSCTKRINLIKKHTHFNSYLDIGSQLGYFVFSLQQQNKICHGLESNPTAVKYSQALASLNQSQNIAFHNTHLTPKTAQNLPDYDLITCLSVYHHLVHYQGKAKADQIIKTLIKKCKYFVFEAGQHNEPGFVWSKSMQFMGKDSKAWLKNYFKKLNCQIIHIAKTKTHLKTTRYLIIVRTPSPNRKNPSTKTA